MRISYYSLFIILGIFHAAPGVTAHAEDVTLSEVLLRAASHTALVAGEVEIARRQALVGLAGERGPTTISLEIEELSGRSPGFSESESTLLVKRPFLDGKRLGAARALAQAGLEQARQAKQGSLRQITGAAQTAFHRALLQAGLEKAASEAVFLAERGVAAARTRVEAGAAPGSEILKAEVELERARVAMERAGSRFRELQIELARAIGQPDLPSLVPVGTMTGDIVLPERAFLAENMLNFHPSFRELDAAENERRAHEKAVNADRRTQWAAGGGFKRFQEDDSHTFVIELEAELPDRRTARRARRDIESEAKKLEAERRARKLDLERELDSQIMRFSGAKSGVKRLVSNVIPDTERLMEMAFEGYRLGRTDQLVVLEAQKAFLESRREHAEALGELYDAADAIESLCGVCLVGESH